MIADVEVSRHSRIGSHYFCICKQVVRTRLSSGEAGDAHALPYKDRGDCPVTMKYGDVRNPSIVGSSCHLVMQASKQVGNGGVDERGEIANHVVPVTIRDIIRVKGRAGADVIEGARPAAAPCEDQRETTKARNSRLLHIGGQLVAACND